MKRIEAKAVVAALTGLRVDDYTARPAGNGACSQGASQERCHLATRGLHPRICTSGSIKPAVELQQIPVGI